MSLAPSTDVRSTAASTGDTDISQRPPQGPSLTRSRHRPDRNPAAQ